MKGRIATAVKEYKEKFYGTAEGSFYSSDVLEVRELAEQGNPDDLLFNAIAAALEAGYIIGLRKGMRDSHKKQAGATATE